MKAISPMIAVVLLIAFTVAIGGLVSVWFSNLTSSQTATVQSSAESLANCAASTLTVSEVRWGTTGTSRLVNVTVHSGGEENLKNVSITVVGLGGAISSPKFFNATGDDMTPGQFYATSMNVTSNVSGLPPELVSVTGVCKNSYSVRGECKSGDACMKS